MQAAHAAYESAARLGCPGEHPHFAVCSIPSERALAKAASRLAAAGVRFATFEEPDLGGELTALATEPLRGDRRRALSRYSLLKEAPCKTERRSVP